MCHLLLSNNNPEGLENKESKVDPEGMTTMALTKGRTHITRRRPVCAGINFCGDFQMILWRIRIVAGHEIERQKIDRQDDVDHFHLIKIGRIICGYD